MMRKTNLSVYLSQSIFLALVALSSARVASREIAAKSFSEESSQGSAKNEEATIYVVVRDTGGHFVDGLTSLDFRLFLDGREHPITSFRHGKPKPISIALSLQWSGQRRDTLPNQEIAPAAQFLRATVGNDDAAYIARFSDKFVVLSDFQNDADVLDRVLHLASGVVPWGPPALYDSLDRVANEILVDRAGGRAIVVVADERDHGSRKTLRDVMESCIQARAVVFFVSLAVANPYMKRAGRGAAEDVAKKITKETGGDVYFPRNSIELEQAFRKINETLNNTYALGFASPNSTSVRKPHKVKVQALRRNVRVLSPRSW